MKHLRQKLHSQTGASFLLALLAFLVASMVSVTIVVAALTSVKRVNSDQKEQQAHLTLTSAAQLVCDRMEDTEYVKTEVFTSPSTEESNQVSNGGTIETTITSSGTFFMEMRTAVGVVDGGNQYNSSESAILIKTEGIEMETVKVSFVMKEEEGEKYKVIFTLFLDNSEETVYLTMDGKVDVNRDTTTNTTTTIITWNNPIINGLGG